MFCLIINICDDMNNEESVLYTVRLLYYIPWRSLSSETNSVSGDQEIPILWKLKVQYQVYKSLPLNSIVSQLNTVFIPY